MKHTSEPASIEEVRQGVLAAGQRILPPAIQFTTEEFLDLWKSLPPLSTPPQGKFSGHMLYPRDVKGKGALYYGFRLMEYLGRLTGLFHWKGKIFVDSFALALPFRLLRGFVLNFNYFDAVLSTAASVIDDQPCTLMTYKNTPVVDEIRAIDEDTFFGIIYTQKQSMLMFFIWYLRPRRRRDTLWTFFALYRDKETFSESRR